jgi:hypothetical protein
LRRRAGRGLIAYRPAAMSEHRSERVIHGDARLERSRSFVGVVVVLGFLLAAIVGLSSSSSPWLPDDGVGSSAPAIVGNVLAVALAVGLCVLFALIWVISPRPSKAKPRAAPAVAVEDVAAGLRSGTLVLVGGLVAVAFLIGAFWFLLEQANVAQLPPQPTVTSGGDEVPAAPPDTPARASPVFHWFALGLAGSIAVLVPLGLVVRHRRREVDAVDEPGPLPDSVARAVGDSIDQIERDPDSRRAIIRAYARMEGAFDEAGIPRRPYEAPFEYVGRALRGLRVSPPTVGRLAALFERARFSQHVVGAETKDEALGALREIDRQMKEPPE